MATKNNSNGAALSVGEQFLAWLGTESFGVTIGKREGAPTFIPVPMADMPLNALQAMFTYGVQRKFNDAVGGADVALADKVKAAGEMVAAFTRGEVAKARGTGESVDPVTAEIRSLVRPEVKAGWIKENDAAGWKAMDEADIVAMCDATFAEQDDETQAAIREVAESNVAAKAAIRTASKSFTLKTK